MPKKNFISRLYETTKYKINYRLGESVNTYLAKQTGSSSWFNDIIRGIALVKRYQDKKNNDAALNQPDRCKLIDESRDCYINNPIAKNQVQFKTDSLIDRNTKILCPHSGVLEKLQELADRNKLFSQLRFWCNDFQVEGDIYISLEYFPDWYIIPARQIIDTIQDTEIPSKTNFYIREWQEDIKTYNQSSGNIDIKSKLRRAKIPSELIVHGRLPNCATNDTQSIPDLTAGVKWLKLNEEVAWIKATGEKVKNAVALQIQMKGANQTDIDTKTAEIETEEWREKLLNGGLINVTNENVEWKLHGITGGGGTSSDLSRESKMMAVANSRLSESHVTGDYSNSNLASTYSAEMPYRKTISSFQDLVNDVLIELLHKSIAIMVSRGELTKRIKVSKYISDLSESQIKLLDTYNLLIQNKKYYNTLSLVESINEIEQIDKLLNPLKESIIKTINKDNGNKNKYERFRIEFDRIINVNTKLNEAIVTEYIDTVLVPVSIAFPKIVASEGLQQAQIMAIQRNLGNSSPQSDCEELGKDYYEILQQNEEAYKNEVMIELAKKFASQANEVQRIGSAETDKSAGNANQMERTKEVKGNKANQIYK